MSQSFVIYTVGGAVRDTLLGLPVKDRDYVVVGADPKQMQAWGYVPVGKDFPVFLHPQTHEEYALARTERKTAPGYAGFAFHAAADVTLEQDLQRRDLTINAIAMDEQGNFIDPYGGRADIEKKIFRHVSEAFAEDPVRILRLARFSARFHDFTIATETMHLMQKMVRDGEVNALVPERVWQELSRGLMEKKPSRMFEVLRECGALQSILPELYALVTQSHSSLSVSNSNAYAYAMEIIDQAADKNLNLSIRLAVLLRDLASESESVTNASELTLLTAAHTQLVEAVCTRLKVQNEVRDLAVLVARESNNIHRVSRLSPEMILKLLERCDAFRRPERFNDLLTALQCEQSLDTQSARFAGPQADLLKSARSAAQKVPAGEIAASVTAAFPVRASEHIAQAIHRARVEAIAQTLQLSSSH